jgi:esterase
MKLHHHVIGHGAPLLILHGLLGSLDNWVPAAQGLAAQFQVFLLDLRNHGRSPHAEDATYDAMAADVAEFMRAQNLGSVSLLGHSMGGKVAMRFAQRHPELTRKLVVADMSPREYPPRYAAVLEAMSALDVRQFQQRSEVEAALVAVAPDQSIRQFLLKNLGRDEAGGLRWKPNLAALCANYSHLRGALPVERPFAGPTLFVRGGQSDYIRDADVPLIRRFFPRAQLETIAAAGHWLHAEAPQEFLRIVSGFLVAET